MGTRGKKTRVNAIAGSAAGEAAKEALELLQQREAHGEPGGFGRAARRAAG